MTEDDHDIIIGGYGFDLQELKVESVVLSTYARTNPAWEMHPEKRIEALVLTDGSKAVRIKLPEYTLDNYVLLWENDK